MRASARRLAPAGLILLAVAGLAVVVRRARLEPMLVHGDSMRPTLDPGQRIAVGPLRRTPRRGEVVLLRHDGLEMVKRVVGLPEERVRLVDGRLEVDGRHVPEPYAVEGPAQADAVELDVRLGHEELLVLGDSRRHSTDSRSFGPVHRDDVIGIVRFAYWPPRRVNREGSRESERGAPVNREGGAAVNRARMREF